MLIMSDIIVDVAEQECVVYTEAFDRILLTTSGATSLL